MNLASPTSVRTQCTIFLTSCFIASTRIQYISTAFCTCTEIFSASFCRLENEHKLEDSCEDPSENQLNIPVRQQLKGPRRRFPHGMLRLLKSTAFRGGLASPKRGQAREGGPWGRWTKSKLAA